jgi:hypothetical protein
VLIPAFLPWHEHHGVALDAMMSIRAVPAHVLVECYSVLTRLPAPHRLSAAIAADLIARVPGEPLVLPPEAYAVTLRTLAGAGIRGGAAYDGLVGATAAAHGRRLVTIDRRAIPTYEAVGASHRTLTP